MNNCCDKCQAIGIIDKETLYCCIDPVCECHKDHRLMRPKGKKCDCIYCMNPSHHEEYLESVSKQEKPEWIKEFDDRFEQKHRVSMPIPEGGVYEYDTKRIKNFIASLLLSEKKRWVEKMKGLKPKIEALGHQQDDDTIWCKMDDVLHILSQEL